MQLRNQSGFLLLTLLLGIPVLTPPSSRAVDSAVEAIPPSWSADFEAVCAKTPDVMSLPIEDLRRLLAECERLRPLIEALPESPRKVYRKRLDMTSRLLAFALELRTLPPPTKPLP